MNQTLLRMLAVALVAGLSAWLAGCDEKTDAEFATGAFPPVLSDAEYHARSWARGDCLTCHESGVADAPKMEHRSVPDLAKKAKCRTCHVFVSGEAPR